MSNGTEGSNLRIAIVGMALRFPGADHVDAFWRNLEAGVESITTFSADELLAAGVPHEIASQPNYVPARAIVPDLEQFDAAFFGMTPREAALLDPQQRLLLECGWEALETSGCAKEAEVRPCGVYAGVGMNGYLLHNLLPNRALFESTGGFQVMLGNDKDFCATRLSYKLNLRGPSLAVQTACSSSLTAIHLACQALLQGECDLALAGGSAAFSPQRTGYLHEPGMILSPDGHCRPFDARAEGTVPGSGAAMVLLKRLDDAIAAGDSIQAIVLGSAINNDGAVKVGYTAPSEEGQRAVIAEALALAGAEPESIGYIETHGTGTPQGDPIEFSALQRVFARTEPGVRCALGSVKSNLGHLDAAAGVAGLIKAVLALRHRAIPRTLHFERANPLIDLAASPFYVPTATVPWETQNGTPRRAGVSSFGIGGTNAHVVLQEAPPLPPSAASRPRHAFVLSARTATALEHAARDLAASLEAQPHVELADAAYTLNAGRRLFAHRRLFSSDDRATCIESLRAFRTSGHTGPRESVNRRAVFLFPGQGTQYAAMGRGLYESEPAFRREFDRCADLLLPHLGRDLRDVLFHGSPGEIDRTEFAQPALFVVEYALAQCLAAWGVRRSALFGHSLGEWVAACVAGVISLEDALRIVALRARLMQAQPPGAMLAVRLDEAALAPYLSDELALAAVNAPKLCSVSGGLEAIAALAQRLEEEGIGSRRISTSHAFHSPMMEPVMAPLGEALGRIRLSRPRIRIAANLTGRWLTDEEAVDPQYWARQLREPVRCADALQLLLEPGAALIEVGPGSLFTKLVAQLPGRPADVSIIPLLPRSARPQDEAAHLVEAAGQLHLAGVSFDWSAFHAGEGRRRVALPPHPFQKERCWIEPVVRTPEPASRMPAADWFYLPGWRRSLAPAASIPAAPGHWLLVGALDEPPAAALAERMRTAGGHATGLAAWPDSAEAWREAIETAGALRGIVLFETSSGLAEMLSLVALARVLPGTPLTIVAVRRESLAISGHEQPLPARALVTGVLRVLPQEEPALTVRTVDFDAASWNACTQAAHGLFAEIFAASGDELIAYRGTARWTPSFEPVPAPLARGDSRLRERGVYLITGGLGGIGLTLAAELARSCQARLVLVSRSPWAGREEWERLATSGEPRVSRQARLLLELESSGAEILLCQADVADETAMTAVVAAAQQRFGGLHGVIHTAGAPGGGVLAGKSEAALAAVLRAKVDGTDVLDRVCADLELDFMALCSSVSGWLGGFGQADYCAANLYLDAFAEARSHRGRPTFSILWDTWGEVGMAVESEPPPALRPSREEELRRFALSPAEGAAAFRRALTLGQPQVVVSTRDFTARYAGRNSGYSEHLEKIVAPSSVRHARPSLAVAFAAPRDETEIRLAAIWSAHLGFDQIGIDDDYFELGGDSLKGITLVAEMQKEFGPRVRLSALFEAPTIAKFAHVLSAVKEPAAASAPPPPSRLAPGTDRITPDLLPLITLTQTEIDELVRTVAGGAANVQDVYPLTPLQEGLLFHHRLQETGDSYLFHSLLALETEAGGEAIAMALQKVIDRHDILRTAVVSEKLSAPVQVVWREAKLPVEIRRFDLAAGPVAGQLTAEFRAGRSRLDLTQAPLLRVVLAEDRGRWLLLFVFHHLVIDHTSLLIVLEEVVAHLHGTQAQLPPPVPFRDFVATAAAVSAAEHEAFFREMLGTLDTPTLPFGLVDVMGDGSRMREAHRVLPTALAQRLRTQGRRLGVTPAGLCHLAWALVLSRCCNRPDVVFGTVMFGRLHGGENVERALGMFINTLPLRVRFDSRPLAVALRETQQDLLRLMRHEHASLALAQRCSACPVGPETPLFSALLNYRHTAEVGAAPALPGVEILQGEDRTNYPFCLAVDDFGDGFALTAQVVGVEPERVCALMETAFATIVAALETAPETPLYTLDALPAEERRQLLGDWNLPAAPLPQECIHTLFEVQAAARPDAPAVTCDGAVLTYRELNARANQLAHALIALGVGPDTLVAIALPRSREMIVALLATLKAGGAYVPLDLDYPPERLSFMLEDSGARVLLTQEAIRAQLPRAAGPTLCLENEATRLAQLPDTNPPSAVCPQNLAYVIYTSGSTGNPKGCLVTHANVTRLLHATDSWYGFGPDDVWTLFHSYAFDFSVWEIWGALLYGGRLAVVPFEVSRSPDDFLRFLEREKVTVLNQTPSAFRQLINAGEARPAALCLRYVIFGGEALEFSMLARWFECRGDAQPQLVNMYGITETTVHVTYRPIVHADLAAGRGSNIGVRIPDLTLYVVDRHLQPLPIGVAGELLVGGAGLARGYLHRPGLTAERFIPDAFSGQPGQRLYRTGDLARFGADGQLEYLGRIDQQVKLRGFRIELGEIEAALTAQPSVGEAVVLLRGRDGDRQLVAYVVPHFGGEQSASAAELREALNARLPDYMVPAAWVFLPALPLTANGKLDRNALPEPDAAFDCGDEYVAPETATERKLAAVWERVLNRQRIGARSNFFNLGGDSLKAIRLVNGIVDEIGERVAIKDVFRFPTVSGLADLIDRQSAEASQGAELESATAPLDRLKEAVLSNPEQTRRLPADWEDFYPMSDIEAGMVFHNLLEPGEGIYHDQFTYQLVDPEFDFALFTAAFERLVAKHPVLRTSLHVDGFPEPLQIVHRAGRLDLAFEEFPSADPEAQQSWLATFMARDRERPFDVTQPGLWRMRVFRQSPDTLTLLWVFHHAILDGWSNASFITELANAYFQLKARPEWQPAPLASSCREFIADQVRWRNSSAALDYWRGVLRDYRKTGVPFAGQLSPGAASGARAIHGVEIEPALAAALTRLAQEEHTPIRHVFLAAFAELLSLTTGRRDVLFGLVANNRPEVADGDTMLGCFLNSVPFRIRLNSAATARRRLHAVDRQVTELKSFERLALPRILEAIGEGTGDGNPLFDVLFNYIDFHVYERVENKTGLKAGIIAGHEATNTPLDFSVSGTFGGYRVNLSYAADVLTARQVERLAAFYLRLLTEFAERPDSPLARPSILGPQEWRRLLELSRSADVPLPAQCIHELFEAHAATRPDAPALVFGRDVLSYGALNARANQLAHVLIELGVQPDAPVALALPRSPQTLVALLAILKAGGAYVPLELDFPPERLAFLLEDSGARIVLTESALRERLPDSLPLTLCLDLEQPRLAAAPEHNPRRHLSPRHLAYVLYTSGSTGLPKGVHVEHRSVVRLVRSSAPLHFTGDEVFLQLAPLGFDASTLEIWGPLLNGARLVIMPPGQAALEEIGRHVREHGVTILWLTAGLFNLMVEERLDDLRQLRRLFAGGEALSLPHVQKAVAALGSPKVINGYGPTENTTFTCCHPIPDGISTAVPIGRPIAHTRTYLLDEAFQPVPAGVAAELCTGGSGLARGYLHGPALTAERFVPSPFDDEPGERLYRTGDLARYRDDGEIEYLGRIDRQVKLRGFRIEPGEIEANLAAHPAIRETVVLIRADLDGHRQIVAYVVAQPESEDRLDAAELRAFLEARLPHYMVPGAWAFLPALPLTANGKVDRNALPAPAQSSAESFVAPSSPDEQVLAAIWAQLLRQPRVGLHDHFFELGGHSLLATQLVSRVREAFGVAVPLRDLFEHPVLADFASAVRRAREAGTEATPPLAPLTRPAGLPTSFAQERLWFLHQLEAENPFYNISLALRLEGALEPAMLERALAALLRRHEALRTNFHVVDGRPLQVIGPVPLRSLAILDLSDLAADAREPEAIRLAENFARRPFDLAADPLFRAQLLRLTAREHILLVSLHHIVSDGWSMGVLKRELAELYDAERAGREAALAPLPIQYADFAGWQREWLTGPTLERQLSYWKGQLDGAPAGLKLPTDRPRPAVQSFRGRIETFELDGDLTAKLRRLSHESGATLFMTLLTGFAVLLARYANQTDLVIGSPIANRTRREVESLIGFFVNTLAFRVRLSPGLTLRELLTHVRKDALDAYSHQDLPFERLVDELETGRDLSRNPLFQVMFALQNAPDETQTLEGLTISPVKIEAVSAQFDLVLDVWETGETLGCVLEYSTDLFDRETAARLLRHYRNLLAAIVADPGQPVAALPLVDADERALLLDGFNPVQRRYPVDRTLHQLFEEAAARRPQQPAIVDHRAASSYAELDDRANRLAHLLRQSGVGRGDFVGILEERGCDFLAAVLGVLKVGAAFLPLDPAYPAERLRHMIEDSAIASLITRGEFLGGLPPIRSVLDLDSAELSQVSTENPAAAGAPSDVAYLLYTSGSSGTPKGAMVRHDGAVNHIFAELELLGCGDDLIFLQSAPCSSDISVWQFLAPVLAGGCVVVADFETVCDPAQLLERIQRERVTLIELVPAVLSALLQHVRALAPEARALPKLRRAMVTGEAVSVALINAWLELYPGIPIVNAYGPTEAADDVCQCEIAVPLPAHSPAVPIGQPLPNVWLYVLDRELALVPIGVPGEICVSGIAVGAGYWNDPARTAHCFPPNPYAGEIRGPTLYRTGDLGRWLPDGRLEYLGRFDEQVKLRGFRIELGEIESVLTQHAAVREAAVVARTNAAGETSLAAYVTPQFPRESSSGFDALEDQQIGLWTDLHDDSYGAAGGDDPTFNCIGWDSNYTGLPLSEAEMREYVGGTVDRILSLRPRRLLEIGCGTGLLMFPLVPACEEYLGVDLSATAIAQLRRLQSSPALQARIAGLERARFSCARADRISELDAETFDTAILPSVVQYFPSLEYLDRLLRRLAGRLSHGGSIFVGDVRNLQLLEAFHASVQLFKAPADLPAGELRRRIARAVAHEQELSIHPDYFRSLPDRLPGLASVEILPKRGRHLNEMTRFRYDVVLRLGDQKVTPSEPPAKWNGSRWPECLDRVPCGWREVPNARVHEAAAVLEWLGAAGENDTVAQFRQRLELHHSTGLDPQEFWDFASAAAHPAFIQLSTNGPAGSLSVQVGALAELSLLAATPAPSRPFAELSNQPLLEKFSRDFIPQFRAFLKSRLPGHMVPADFVVLDRLPLTPAGKVDRRNLPAPQAATALRGSSAEALQTDSERKLVEIWSAVLGVEGIGRKDNFFELGGHSLKATQVVSRLEQTLGLKISLREVFNNPTPAEFAPLLETGAAAGPRLIPHLPEQEHYPVSHAQRRLWVLAQLDPGSLAYNMPSAVRLDGPLDRAAFERALDWIVQRHETLRTHFLDVAGEPRQCVSPDVRARLDYRDLRAAASPAEQARQLAEADARQPFDLASRPLFRLGLFRIAEESHVFVATLHHIISDDWSGAVLIRELAEAYAASTAGREPERAPLRIHYCDYGAWQNRWLAEDAAADRDYWHAHLAGHLPALELPFARPRPAVKTDAGERTHFVWDRTLSRRLAEFGRERGASLFMTLLAGVTALLHRYSRQRDIIVGSPVAGRNHADLEQQIGFYVNTLALRSSLNPRATFEQFLAATVAMATAALDHQAYPFDRLVTELKVRRDVSRSPLFDVMVVLQNPKSEAQNLPGLRLAAFPFETKTSQFDLNFSFEEIQGKLHGEITFNPDLFTRKAIARMVGHLRTLVEGFLAAPVTSLDRLPLLGPAERAALLPSTTASVSAPAATIVERFEQQVRLTPGADAVSCEGTRLTYDALNRRANQLARRLRSLGISRGARVGLLTERSHEMIIGVLGILKAGAAYVPFDPEYPAERRAFMAADSGIVAMVTFGVAEPAQLSGVPRVDLADPSLATESGHDLLPAATPLDPAYIIYTSGSTGQPKGVPVPHWNVVRLLDQCQPWFHFDRDDVWTLFHSVAFDFSVWELWGPLCHGGRLVVVPYWISRSPKDFLALLAREKVTVLNQTPSAFRALISADDAPASPALALRYVIFGGEALEPSTLQPWIDRHGEESPRLVNMYGITETTVHVTYRVIGAGDLQQDASVIGEPIPDLQLYLLDETLQPVPTGLPGEICVGGAGLALGYLNQPALTASRFIPNPYGPDPGSRLYRSGDLARRLENGDLEYLGRADEQVKIRGFRIEPGEIASHLSTHPSVRHAVVTPVSQAGEKRLAAYVVPRPGAAIAAHELRLFLRERVPEYMVPASFTAIDELPLTPHGKLDRRALPAPVEQRASAETVALPQSEAESTIAAVWAELLAVERVGTDENIFDLGAHSLAIIQAQRLFAERAGWNLTVLDLFRHPTVAGLARFVSAESTPEATPLAAAESRADERRQARKRRAAAVAGKPA